MNRTKQLLISCLVLLCYGTTAWADVEINETNFPDENFRNWVRGQEYGSDGVLTDEEIAVVASINVSNKQIQSLKGIEFFTALTKLECDGNQLTALDLTKNTALIVLYCGENHLTSLDVSENTALNMLSCPVNQLTELDVSKNTALTWLYCDRNQLTALNVTGCAALIELMCGINQLASLDVSECTALDRLYCFSNQLTALDLTKNTALGKLWCSENQIIGEAMDALIESLPTGSDNTMQVISNENEGNVMTTVQVAAAKAKGWTPLYYDGEDWEEYEGSEVVDNIREAIVPTRQAGNTFNLAGQHVNKVARQGLYIINGRKIVVKKNLY